MNNLRDHSTDQHTSDGGYTSVYQDDAKNLPFRFSTEPNITRDPDDVLTISTLLRAVSVLLVLLFISLASHVYLSVRRADRIVVDKSSGRVVELNNRDYGATETVSIRHDRPNDTDEK